MNDKTKQLLVELNRNQYGQALREYLNDQLSKLRDVSTIPNNDMMVVETRGRQFAIQVIQDLFSFMEMTKQVEKNKNQYT